MDAADWVSLIKKSPFLEFWECESKEAYGSLSEWRSETTGEVAACPGGEFQTGQTVFAIGGEYPSIRPIQMLISGQAGWDALFMVRCSSEFPVPHEHANK